MGSEAPPRETIHLIIIVTSIIVIIAGGGHHRAGRLGLAETIEQNVGETEVGNGNLQCGNVPHIKPTISRRAHAQATPPSQRDVGARGPVCRAWERGKPPCGKVFDVGILSVVL